MVPAGTVASGLYITHLSRKQVRESIAVAVKTTMERARALAATPSSAVAVAPLSTIPTLDGRGGDA